MDFASQINNRNKIFQLIEDNYKQNIKNTDEFEKIINDELYCYMRKMFIEELINTKLNLNNFECIYFIMIKNINKINTEDELKIIFNKLVQDYSLK